MYSCKCTWHIFKPKCLQLSSLSIFLTNRCKKQKWRRQVKTSIIHNKQKGNTFYWTQIHHSCFNIQHSFRSIFDWKVDSCVQDKSRSNKKLYFRRTFDCNVCIFCDRIRISLFILEAGWVDNEDELEFDSLHKRTFGNYGEAFRKGNIIVYALFPVVWALIEKRGGWNLLKTGSSDQPAAIVS